MSLFYFVRHGKISSSKAKEMIAMAKKAFSWGNFSYDFIKGIVYGRETPARLQPKTLYEAKEYDFLSPYVNRICKYPDEFFVRKYRKNGKNTG